MKKLALLAVFVGAGFAVSGSVNAGDVVEGSKAAVQCAACHGKDGNSISTLWPKIAGQNEKYLIKQINDFRAGAKDPKTGRLEPQMLAIWANVKDEDVPNLAAYFASQETQLGAVKKEYVELGKVIYFQGDAERGVPACTACHGVTGKGVDAAGYPGVSGQYPEYTIKQLKLFASGERHNDDNSVMRDIAVRMSDKQIEAVAHFMLGLH